MTKNDIQPSQNTIMRFASTHGDPKLCYLQNLRLGLLLDLKNRDLNVKTGYENSLFNHSHQLTTTICHKYELYGSE